MPPRNQGRLITRSPRAFARCKNDIDLNLDALQLPVYQLSSGNCLTKNDVIGMIRAGGRGGHLFDPWTNVMLSQNEEYNLRRWQQHNAMIDAAADEIAAPMIAELERATDQGRRPVPETWFAWFTRHAFNLEFSQQSIQLIIHVLRNGIYTDRPEVAGQALRVAIATYIRFQDMTQGHDGQLNQWYYTRVFPLTLRDMFRYTGLLR